MYLGKWVNENIEKKYIKSKIYLDVKMNLLNFMFSVQVWPFS